MSQSLRYKTAPAVPLILTTDIGDGNSLIARARSASLTLMVGHLLRYHPAFRALLAAVRAGVIGRLQYIYSNRLSLGRIRISENAL